MPSEWIVSVPVWGERYTKIFAEQCRPALLAAAERTGLRVRFLIHTDKESRAELTSALAESTHQIRSLPKAESWWQQMTLAHKDALRSARRGDFVMPLTADMVVSPEVFSACEARFAQGKHLILCCGIRAVDDGTPPDRSSSAALLEWAWAHKHKLTTESMWPDGRSGNWTGIYFERGDHVIFRPRYPHPIAVMPYGHGTVIFPTIDADYSNNFRQEEIYVVTDSCELSAIELSPRSKALEFVEPTFEERVRTNRLQQFRTLPRWIFDHRIVIKGSANFIDSDADIDPPMMPMPKTRWRRNWQRKRIR